MNLLLLNDDRPRALLPAGDPRAIHLRDVLRFGVGSGLDVGCVNGPRGRAVIETLGAEGITLSITWGAPPPPLPPLRLWIGLPRPASAKRILSEATALGVAEMVFFAPGRGEKSYADASLWKDGEWRETIRQGAEQAYSTRIPEVRLAGTLTELLAEPGTGKRLALDNYEAAGPLPGALPNAGPLTLIFGAERGFTETERSALRAAGVPLAHLGERVLRTETAVLAATSLALAALGAWTSNTPSSRGS